MQRRWAHALVLAATLLAGLTAPAAPASAADGKPLEPVRVALGELPGTVELAILEAEDRLLSSEAQHRMAVVHAYVQGFAALPAGSAALADPATRAAYSWAEEAVETALGLPQQLDALEAAGSTCRSYGNAGTAEQIEGALTEGPHAEATLQVLRSEMDALAARVPAGVDRTPFDRTVALLAGYLSAEGSDIHACLATLHAPDRTADLPDLFAVVLPPETFRTGHVRVVGTVRGASDVAASASSLSVSGRAQAANGTFRIPLTIPRGAALGDHTITVKAGSLSAAANVTVAKAEVSLSLQAPSRVVANTTFTALVSVSSPAGTALVDRVPVRLSWRGNETSLALHNATARRSLDSGRPSASALVPLNASFAGDDVLAPANATLAVEVYKPGAVATAQANPFGVPLSWFWWLLVLIAGVGGAILLYLMPVILHRARGSRGQALRGNPSPPRWPGAASFVAAVAALFDLLRRRRLAPPGQTVREWLGAHGGPDAIADRFEAVRYGGAPEDDQLRKTGLSWAEKAWERWRNREP
jgi:hypothetical protein